jgi:hypothetical protein
MWVCPIGGQAMSCGKCGTKGEKKKDDKKKK